MTMAFDRRQPDDGLLHHSDQGCQYAAKQYCKLLDAHGVVPSMSRKGNCYDAIRYAGVSRSRSVPKIDQRHRSNIGTLRGAHAPSTEQFSHTIATSDQL